MTRNQLRLLLAGIVVIAATAWATFLLQHAGRLPAWTLALPFVLLLALLVTLFRGVAARRRQEAAIRARGTRTTGQVTGSRSAGTINHAEYYELELRLADLSTASVIVCTPQPPPDGAVLQVMVSPEFPGMAALPDPATSGPRIPLAGPYA